MSLLREIQDQAVDSKSDLGELLRKCKVLASRLGSKPLQQWVVWESNGYPSEAELPDYRIWPMELRGDFGGPFGSAITNAPIPTLSVPEELREAFTQFRCRQSVASIEQTLSNDTSQGLRISTGDLAIVLKVYSGYSCIQAWGTFSTYELIEVLNAVRNRLLDFVLALEKEQPDAGETAQVAAKIGEEKITQIFNTTINGSANLIGAVNGPLHKMGEIHMRDTYKAGQAGAMGPGAHAHEMTFQQIWNQHGGNIDLGKLQTELATLRQALSQQASDPEHQIVIGSIAAAEKAAAAGDGPKALGYLKNAGPWALGIATSVGVPIAIAAIKFALGL